MILETLQCSHFYINIYFSLYQYLYFSTSVFCCIYKIQEVCMLYFNTHRKKLLKAKVQLPLHLRHMDTFKGKLQNSLAPLDMVWYSSCSKNTERIRNAQTRLEGQENFEKVPGSIDWCCVN